MKPIDFPQSTKVLQKPSTMSDKECSSLHVWNDGKQCVSCWKPTFKERINILFGGNASSGAYAGFVSAYTYNTATYTSASFGSRLCFYPQIEAA